MANQISSNREELQKIEEEINQEIKEDMIKYGHVSVDVIYRKIYKKLGMEIRWPDLIGFEGEITNA